MELAVGLAIAGIAATARADDPAGSGSSPKVSLGGYLETFYSVNFAFPSNRLTNLRAFDNRDLTFTLSNVALSGKVEQGPLTAIVILQVGTTPSTYYLGEPSSPGDSSVAPSNAALWQHVQQATLAYVGPADLTFQAGLFPSPIGPEVIPIKDDWNWSRSDLFFALPFYHTGVVVSRPLGCGWTAALHVYNGWNSVVDNNDTPSVAASVSYASGRVPAAQIMYFGGNERPTGAPEGAPWRHLFDAYAQVAVTERFSLMAQLDGGFEHNRLGTSGWIAGAAYAKLAVTPELYGAVRADLFREWVAPGARAIFWPTPWIGSFTATFAYKPVARLSVRIELRHDQAKRPVFYGGDVVGDGITTPYVADRDSRDTITFGATAWF